MALQIVKNAGGRAVAVVSSDDKRQFCLDHGAAGVINRGGFSHWGAMPDTEGPDYLVLEGACCGYGASGRNGGFCVTCRQPQPSLLRPDRLAELLREGCGVAHEEVRPTTLQIGE